MNDRDLKEQLFTFKERAVVFFAVDTDDVFMSTRLNNEKTFFLPFNILIKETKEERETRQIGITIRQLIFGKGKGYGGYFLKASGS